jgi:hypothetical protein
MKERGHLDDLGIDGRIILKWILRNLDVRMSTGPVDGCCEHSNVPFKVFYNVP